MKLNSKTRKEIEKALMENVWEFYIHENNYKGGKKAQLSTSEVRNVLEDLQDGTAIIEKLWTGGYEIRYAGKNHWVTV